MTDSEKKYWLAFLRIPNVCHKTVISLFEHFQSLERAWRASSAELKNILSNQALIKDIIKARKTINPDQELEKIKKHNIKILTFAEKNYPYLLRQIAYPPAVLFYQGSWEKYSERAIAVVGTRKMTTYGKQVCQQIVQELVANDINIISGLAIGIDAQAHLTTIKNHGYTIAVLGSGLNKIYPKQNESLAKQIISQAGAVISEYFPDTSARREFFPARNRIIAGLAKGCLVIEAGKKSGASITAYFSLEQNREVFAVPGNLNNPMSQGTNQLIQKGAYLITSADDILDLLNFKKTTTAKKQKLLDLTENEKLILNSLSTESMTIDQLIKATKLSPSIINATLITLEIKGLITNSETFISTCLS